MHGAIHARCPESVTALVLNHRQVRGTGVGLHPLPCQLVVQFVGGCVHDGICTMHVVTTWSSPHGHHGGRVCVCVLLLLTRAGKCKSVFKTLW